MKDLDIELQEISWDYGEYMLNKLLLNTSFIAFWDNSFRFIPFVFNT